MTGRMVGKTCVIGIDVGGTNTDAAILCNRRVIASSKQMTTGDVSTGVIRSLYHALMNCPEKEIQLQQINIGTTHFINAVVQRSADLSKVVVLRLARPPCTEAMPPFYDFPKSLRQIVEGGWHLLNGGYEFDGREMSGINEEEIRKAVDESLSKHGHTHFVLCGVFSPVKHDQEDKAKKIILEHFPTVSVTCSHELGHLGFLDRENAAILNESLKGLARKTLAQLEQAIANELGLTCPIYLTQNDGTVCSIDQAMQFPVLTFASGATNSMRGAAFISGMKNGVVVDIGGTSTDVGLLTEGFPKEANSKIYVGGVPTFFRMPLTFSIGIGGGSIVREGDGGVSVGPDSVGYRLTSESVCFGGKVLTATDIAAAFGQAPGICRDFPELKRIGQSEMGKSALALIRKKVETAVDHVKTDKHPVPIVLVGGGAILIDTKQPMVGCSEIISVEHAQIANAIGAALCQVSGSVDIVASVDPGQPESRMAAMEDAKNKAVQAAIDNGAMEKSVQIVDCVELPLTYLPGNAVQYKIRAIGDLAVITGKSVMIDLDGCRLKAPPEAISAKADGSVYTQAFAPSPRGDEEFLEGESRGDNPYDEKGEWILDRYDIECMSIGAGILGCGGGGSPRSGKVQMLHLLTKGKRPRVVTLDRFLSEKDASTSITLGVGVMGAPVISTEKLQTNRAIPLAISVAVDILENPKAYETIPVHKYDGGVTYSDHMPVPNDILERILRNGATFKPPISVMPFEVGGENTMEPLVMSAAIGIPCVDVDGMGRAYPELQMYTPYVYGAPWTPMIQTSDTDRITVVWTANRPKDLENFYREICIQNGCKGNLAYSGVKADMMKSVCVEGSVSRAWRVGRAVLEARRHKRSPIQAVVDDQGGKLLFIAKIINIDRRLEGGFQRGNVELEDLEKSQNYFKVMFQNENLLVSQKETVLATVPDLICILDMDSGDTITTDDLRYGLRVAVVILPPSPMLTDPKALPIFGPKGFGLDIEYRPAFG